MLNGKDLIGLYDKSKEEIEEILLCAENMKRLLKGDIKKLAHLQGRTAVTLFYENSTRTRVSFELAAKYLSAVTINISTNTSSVAKGETLIDTGLTLDAMRTDFIIMRHPMAGAPKLLAQNVRASVVNGGDGMNEHPTQALLDMLTMRETFGEFKGLKVAIMGDIRHSRVARSNIYGLTRLGAEVRVCAPETLIPPGIDKLGAKIASGKNEAISGADVIMGLRIQKERQHGGLFPSFSEYNRFYGVSAEDLSIASPRAVIMHPGPVNRGVELSSEVIDGENSLINEQVLSGVAVRMAVLHLLQQARSKI